MTSYEIRHHRQVIDYVEAATLDEAKRIYEAANPGMSDEVSFTAEVFVIRSMSTTDAHDARGVQQQVIPYHIYLMRPEKRASAWWCRSPLADVMTFATEAEAEAELARLSEGRPYFGGEVAPIDAEKRGLPNYWDKRR